MRYGLTGLVILAALCLTAGLGAQGPAVADAAMQKNVAAVRDLLKHGADVNAAQGDGMTPLHWAATHGDLELSKMLLVAGANIRATTRINGYTPLFLAAREGNAGVVAALLDAGADPQAVSATGSTPLMLAAGAGSIEAVERLLDAGAEIDARERARGQTALMFAAAYNRVDAINLLVRRGTDVRTTSKVVDLFELTREDNPAPGSGTAAGGARPAAAAPPSSPVAGVDRAYNYTELIGYMGGMTPLLFAAREGHVEAAEALLAAGADVNQPRAGDRTTPLLMASINGHFDLGKYFLDHGADPNLAGENGATPIYAVLNCVYAQKSNYPQPRAFAQQRQTYLDYMTALLDKGADPNARLKKKVWYSGYNSDLSGVDETGATPFWRAAYASDLPAMKLLVARGADPNVLTVKPAGRPRFGDQQREVTDVSGVPPPPVGGPSVTPLMAATGVGYAEGFAANSHIIHPAGWMPAVKYLVEGLGADVNARDHEGNTPLHNAAARGDVEMILYLVSKGADVKAVNREGQTTADMANGPVQRTQPYPEAVELLVKLGAKNNNKCVSC
ncbi:MAG TPA: ankyrin repeat domain-containing protein [Vicinamibacterales bacterium]|nr:ankyrin repeat domain-containing protein [Vicinamibacterales bacterium]